MRKTAWALALLLSFMLLSPLVLRAGAQTNYGEIPGAWAFDRQSQYLNEAVLRTSPYTIELGNTSYTGNNPNREIDLSMGVAPGDYVFLQGFIKMAANTTNYDWGGGRFGFDYFQGASYIRGYNGAYVPWNTLAWTLRSFSFTVPATVTADPYSPLYDAGDPYHGYVPDAVIFWCQAWDSNGPFMNASAYFTDIIIYKTTAEATPTPSITPTPSPWAPNSTAGLTAFPMIIGLSFAGMVAYGIYRSAKTKGLGAIFETLLILLLLIVGIIALGWLFGGL